MFKKPNKPAVQVSSRPFSGTPSIKWTLGCGSPELVWSKAKIKRSAKSWAKVSKSPMYHSGVMLQKGPRRSSISRWADKRPPRTRILASKTWTIQVNHNLRTNILLNWKYYEMATKFEKKKNLPFFFTFNIWQIRLNYYSMHFQGWCWISHT